MLFSKDSLPSTDMNPMAALKRATHKGQAHFASTGPKGATCRTCTFWAFSGPDGYKADRTLKQFPCRKYRMLMGATGAKVPHEASACSHYQKAEEERPRENPDK